MKIISLVLITLISFFCLLKIINAANLSAPPILKEEPVAEQQYLKKIYDNFNKLEVITTNPDGSRRGSLGEMIIANTGGSYYLEIAVDNPNGTTWRGIALTDTP